jgi:GAF domain-containing protein
MIRDNRVIGVLDIDSPTFERFDDQDREGLEAFVAVLLGSSEQRTADGGR